MKAILDPGNRWIGAPGRVKKFNPGNQRPVAVDDTLVILMDSGPVSVAVLGNDFDPEGATVTLVSASAALGSAVAEANGTVTYTPPPGISGNDTVVYEIADDLDQRDSGQISITLTEPQLSVDATPANTLSVTAETGAIDITVTEPAEFAGIYATDTALLAGGPVNLVVPGISGSASEGQTLSATGGLWIYDTGAAPQVQTWQWRRGGVDIAGADAAGYIVTAGDIAQSLSVSETLADGFGQRSAISAAVNAGFSPVSDPALIGWWDADDAATITQSGGAVSDWADKAGGAALGQTLATRRPLTGARTLNGRNVLDFDGTRFLTTARNLPGSGDLAFHTVCVIDSTANAFEALLSVDATNDFQIDANAANQFEGRLNVAGIGSSATLSGGPFSGALILSVVFDRTGTASAEVFIAGISRGTAAYTLPLDTAVTLLLMTNRSANAWVNGAAGELIVTGDVTNRADHHAYLAAKWGLT